MHNGAAMKQQRQTVAILGGGSFGTALATILANNGHDTRLWVRDPETADAINADRENARYLPGAELPDTVTALESLEDALVGASLVFLAVPSKAFPEILCHARDRVAPDTAVVSCTKGIHEDGFLLMSQLLRQEWPHVRTGVLSGPNLAREIVEHKFTGTVIASEDADLRTRVQDALSCSYFRVYDSPDPFGVELGGALKNIYAIATGMASSLGVGENTRALLITRSLAEMSRLASHLGADPMTFLGLAGVGDLVVTCSSPLSRNYRIGQALGQGQSVSEALEALGQTAEGINTVTLVARRARELGIYMPIVSGLEAILFRDYALETVISGLMQGEHNHDVEFTFQRVTG
jgi:glycerol-3-phosphate dehydrogenase (NAD(P)+)